MTNPLSVSASPMTRHPARVTGAVTPARGSELIITGTPRPAVSLNTPRARAVQCRGLMMLKPVLTMGRSRRLAPSSRTFAISITVRAPRGV